VASALEDALEPAVLRTIDAAVLGEFLRARRWFGEKSRRALDLRIADVIPVAAGDQRWAIARVEVTLEDGARASYQLPLGVRGRDAGRSQPPVAALARVESRRDEGVLFDAIHDAAFRARLGELLTRGEQLAGSGASLVVERVSGQMPALEDAESRVIGGEQSNSSVIFGDVAIFKLFRRLEAGASADVEIARYLTARTSFRNTPELYAVLVLEREGERAVAGMLSRFVAGAEDGWAYALASARARARGADEPRDDRFALDSERLGAVTAQLHAALAAPTDDPAFAPREATTADVARWAGGARASVDRGFELLERLAPTLDQRSRPLALALAGRRLDVLERLDAIVAGLGGAAAAGLLSRHHGDYHLGQVLRAEGDWLIIDFEGEPARPPAERRALNSPARDVAGMLRSFAYAAATAASAEDADRARVARWEEDARAAFLRGYGETSTRPLISLFELEKLFYELAYELNHRPTWAWIPLSGIAAMLSSGAR
jgi:trehalose synthase-fused probable maltokinase